MQLAIVLGVGCSLLFLMILVAKGYSQVQRRLDALTSAFLLFHKQQCCFIAAIEIAGIVMETGKSTAGSQDFIINVPLALTGCLSVVFGLLVVSFLGRLTWLYIVLTIVPVALSMASLHGVRLWWKTIAEVQSGSGGSLSLQAMNLANTHELICGSRASELNSLDVNTVINIHVVWVMCCFSAICCLILAVWHACRSTQILARSDFYQRWTMRYQSITDLAAAKTKESLRLAMSVVFLVTWVSCFAYLFYLYAYFKRHNFVSSQWDFGQIVAITVWAPSIVEFIYMERGKSPEHEDSEHC